MERGGIVFFALVMLVPCLAYAQTWEQAPERRNPFEWMDNLNCMKLKLSKIGRAHV